MTETRCDNTGIFRSSDKVVTANFSFVCLLDLILFLIFFDQLNLNLIHICQNKNENTQRELDLNQAEIKKII